MTTTAYINPTLTEHCMLVRAEMERRRLSVELAVRGLIGRGELPRGVSPKSIRRAMDVRGISTYKPGLARQDNTERYRLRVDTVILDSVCEAVAAVVKERPDLTLAEAVALAAQRGTIPETTERTSVYHGMKRRGMALPRRRRREVPKKARAKVNGGYHAAAERKRRLEACGGPVTREDLDELVREYRARHGKIPRYPPGESGIDPIVLLGLETPKGRGRAGSSRQRAQAVAAE